MHHYTLKMLKLQHSSYILSFFCNGRKNILIKSIFSNMILIPFVLFFLVPATSMASEIETGKLFDSYSRDEMAKIAGYGEEKLSTVLVTGSVNCETCLTGSQTHAWPISGALVTIKCRLNEKKRRAKWTKGMSDENGEFAIELPSDLHGIADLERKCCVKVTKLPKNSLCKPVAVNKHKSLKLSSAGNGIRIYSSGAVRFNHFGAKCRKAPKLISRMSS